LVKKGYTRRKKKKRFPYEKHNPDSAGKCLSQREEIFQVYKGRVSKKKSISSLCSYWKESSAVRGEGIRRGEKTRQEKRKRAESYSEKKKKARSR